MQTEKVDLNAIEKDLTGIISKIVEIGEDKLVENRDKHFFNDLGLDSLIALEIIASIEKKYRIEIEEDQLKYIGSLNSAITLVTNILQGNN